MPSLAAIEPLSSDEPVWLRMFDMHSHQLLQDRMLGNAFGIFQKSSDQPMRAGPVVLKVALREVAKF